MKKELLINALLEYRSEIVPDKIIMVEEQVINTADEMKNWEIRPDYISSSSGSDEKIPSWWSGKKVKVGTMMPEFIKEGEKIGNTFYNDTKRAKKVLTNDKKKSESEMKEKGTDITDLTILPGFGYPAMVYDEIALKNIKKNIKSENSAWTTNDLINLSRLINRSSPKNWKTMTPGTFWVVTNQIMTGSKGFVTLFSDTTHSNNTNVVIVPFDFYTNFYTSVDDSEVNTDKGQMVKIVPYNRYQHNKVVFAVEKLDTENGIMATKLDDDIVLIKITLRDIKKLSST